MIWVILYMGKTVYKKKSFLLQILVSPHKSWTENLVRQKTMLKPWLLIIYICEEEKKMQKVLFQHTMSCCLHVYGLLHCPLPGLLVCHCNINS